MRQSFLPTPYFAHELARAVRMRRREFGLAAPAAQARLRDLLAAGSF